MKSELQLSAEFHPAELSNGQSLVTKIPLVKLIELLLQSPTSPPVSLSSLPSIALSLFPYVFPVVLSLAHVPQRCEI